MTYYIYGKQGGSFKDFNHPSYVKRQADDELLKAIEDGFYSYIFSSRQCGKTTLIKRTMQNLSSEFSSALLDLSVINPKITSQKFYSEIITQLGLKFSLDYDRQHYLEELNKMGESQHTLGLTLFIEQELFPKISTKNIVIFIDEIDALKDVVFPVKDFILFIRSCSQLKGVQDGYDRLTFCLSGVTTVNQLINTTNQNRTPFNIGNAIELSPFDKNDENTRQALMQGLINANIPNYEKIYNEVFSWTGGQPFLTQKIFYLAEQAYQQKKQISLEQLIKKKVIDDWKENDNPEHLRTIETQFKLQNNVDKNLTLYHKLWEKSQGINLAILEKEKQSIDDLIVTGLIAIDEDYVKVYNPIYKKIFNLVWINQQRDKQKEESEESNNKSQQQRKPKPKPNKRALIIVGSYQEDAGAFYQSQIGKAEEIAGILENDGQFDVTRLFENVTVNSLMEKTQKLFNPDDDIPETALFYFLGAGKERYSTYHLVTTDVQTTMGFQLMWLGKCLEKSSIKQKIVWLDCTYGDEWIDFTDVIPEIKNQFLLDSPSYSLISMSPEPKTNIKPEDKGKLTEFLCKELKKKDNHFHSTYSLISSMKSIEQQTIQGSFKPIFLNLGNEQPITLISHQGQPKTEQKPKNINKSPYKGLEAFDEDDSEYFFGRKDLVGRLSHKIILESNFVTVSGPSGSGKSSVVKAGLVAELRRGERARDFDKNTEIVVFRPGARPIENLISALIEKKILLNKEECISELRGKIYESDNYYFKNLRQIVAESSGENSIKNSLILIVDQFEEVFTMCKEEKERKLFFDCLLTANQDLDGKEIFSINTFKILITIRSDFLQNCTKYPDLNRQIDDCNVTISDMKPRDYIEAINGPAKEVGFTIAESLQQAILDDLKEGSSGPLPLLQFVLQQLWERFKEKKEIDNQTPDELTLEDYHDLGGIKGTLEKRAEEVYTKKLTSKKEKKIAEQIFIELTQSVEDRDSNDIKLDLRRRLSKAELIKTLVNEKQSENDINNVINILTSGKARLLIADKENVDIAHEALIRNWSRLKDWIHKNKDATKIRRHLEKVAQEWDTKGKKEELISILSDKELDQAERYSIDAIPLSLTVQEYIKVSQRVRGKGRNAIRENAERKLKDRANQIQRGLLLDKNPGNKDTFKSVIELVRDNYKQNISILGSVKDVLYHFLNIIIKQKDGQIKLEQNIIEMIGHSDNITSVAISPDNKTIVSGSEDQTIRLWDINGNLINETFARENNKITSVAISSNGDIVSGSEDNTVRLRDKNLNQIAKYEHDKKVTSVAITPDGETIVSGSLDKKVRLCNREGDLIAEPFTKHQRFVYGVAITPDGKTIVSGSKDKTVCLWNRNGNLLKEFTAHQGAIKTMAISSDGQTVISGDTSGTVYWWDREDDLINKSPEEHKHNISVNSIAITPDGNITVTGGQDRRLRLWGRNQQLNEWVNIGTAIDVPWKVNSVAITADEKRIIIGGENKTMKLLYCGNWQDWLGIICLIYQRRGQYLDLCSQVQAELNLPSPDDLTKHFSKVLDK